MWTALPSILERMPVASEQGRLGKESCHLGRTWRLSVHPPHGQGGEGFVWNKLLPSVSNSLMVSGEYSESHKAMREKR